MSIAHKFKTIVEELDTNRDLFSPVEKAKHFARWFVASAAKNAGFKNYRVIHTAKLKHRINGRPIRISFRVEADEGVLREIFVRNFYQIDREVKVESVLDIGSNIGCSALYFAARFPGARIVCNEPVRENFELLERNIVQNGLGKTVTAQMQAVADRNGDAIISLSDFHDSHTLMPVHGAKTRSVQVKDICSFGKFDLIKFDIEGSEDAIFTRGKNVLLGAKVLAGEIHSDMIGAVKAKEILGWLNKHFDVEIKTKDPAIHFVAYRKI